MGESSYSVELQRPVLKVVKSPVGNQPIHFPTPLESLQKQTEIKEEATTDPIQFLNSFRTSPHYEGSMKRFMAGRNTEGMSEDEQREFYEEKDGGGGHDLVVFAEMLMKHGVKFNFDISSFSPEIQQLFKEYHDLTVEHLHGIHGDREEILNADRKRSEIHTAIAKELVIAGFVSPMRVARGLVAVINAENEAKLLQDAKLTDSVRLRYMMGAKQ